MDELTLRIVSRLREEPSSLSRNRNYVTFEEPEARRALQVVRFLGSLEKDILEGRACGPVEVLRLGNGPRWQIKLVFPLLKGTRTSYLSEEEYDLLLENPAIRRTLATKEIA